MNLISQILKKASGITASEQEICDEQFLDNDGRYHMQMYLSYYERQESMSNSIQETNMADSFFTPLYSPVSYDAQHSWEEAHRIDTYSGGIKEYIVKSGILRIGKRAFGYNLNLQRIEFPDSLEIIDKEAFIACERLNTIIIPSRVRFIGKDAFDRGTKMIILQGAVPPIISSLGIGVDCQIKVPYLCGDLYRKNRFWHKYKKQILESNDAANEESAT